MESVEGPNEKEAEDKGRHIEAYHFWTSLLNGRRLPRLKDINPDKLEEFKPNCFLVDFPNGYDIPVVRFSGNEVEADGTDFSHDPGVEMSEAPGTSVLAQVKNLIAEVTNVAEPIGFDAQSDDKMGHLRYSRGILLPFSDDNENVHFVLGVVTWLEEPEEEGFEASLASSPDEPDEKHEYHSDKSEFISDDSSSELYDVLEESREAASKVVHVDSRSRDALYEVLAQAYDFRVRAEDNFETYEKILSNAGLREQERAPFTPVIKLIFGKDYDKTRITEYASALCYADRNDQQPEEVKSFIMSMPGGIKGCVRRERAARRLERGESSSGALEQAKEILGSRDAIASVKGIFGEDDFVVLVGRRKKGAKKVEIVGVLNEETQGVSSILKRSAKT